MPKTRLATRLAARKRFKWVIFFSLNYQHFPTDFIQKLVKVMMNIVVIRWIEICVEIKV